jgi:hypothetical protein
MIYNETLDRYAEQFSFRYKNFPFPKLKEGELPFWVLHEGRRHQLNMEHLDMNQLGRYVIVPKASPLTIFLRLYRSDIFLHGTGGGNYEWVNDRIIERFFGIEPPNYFILTATFHIGTVRERNFSYFFMDPVKVRNCIEDYFGEV